MVKRWLDAGKLVDRQVEIEKELWEYEEIMRIKPNFDKTEGAKKIYQRKEYIILAVKKGYIIYNVDKKFKEGHSHLRSFEMSKVIIDNCIKKRKPSTNNLYLLESHIRVSDDDKYKKMIEELIEVKSGKDRLKYRNKNINSKRK